MKTKHWIIVGIIAFILLAPVEASHLIHSATVFIQGLMAGFNLH